MAEQKIYKKKDNGKNATGRPSKYHPKYCEEIVLYFEQKNQDIKDANEEDDLEKAKRAVIKRFPTYVRYARSIGVNKSTLFERASDHKEFSDSMDMCKEIAESILIENGLQGTYNSHFAQFLLKNNYGYKDKSEHEVSGKDGGPIETVDLTKMTKKQLGDYRQSLLQNE